MGPYLLGIDIGTGSTKGIAVNFEGQAIGQAQYHYPVNSPKPGYSEQDPGLILKAFISCVTDMVEKTRGAPYAISFSSAMHSVILVDKNGKALSPMITWADSRAEHIAQELRKSPEGETIYKTSGTPVHAMSPLCKLIWLRDNEGKLFAEAHKFISIKEYVWHYLFNEFEVDYSLASATGFFDIIKLTWNEAACQMAGITKDKLSIPVNTSLKREGLSPARCAELKLNAETRFIIGASDGCCANLGSFVTTPNVASLTIGTSGAVRITSAKPLYNYPAMIFNYLLNENTFVCGGAVNNGGIALNWLLNNFFGNKDSGKAAYDDLFSRIATVPAGSEGLIFLPYLYGERAPLWDTETSGAYFNIKPQHTQAHFLRAGLEGICFALNDVLNTLGQSSGTINQLNISGGFITSAVWTQMLADITGKKLVIAQNEDASAMGAIYLAMEALNLKRVNEAKARDGQQGIVPNEANHRAYQKTFTLFKKLYPALKDMMHSVHDLNV